MDHQDAYLKVRDFFLSKPFVAAALRELKPGVEIRVLLDSTKSCALFFREGEVHFEDRPAKDPHVEFNLGIECLRRIPDLKGETMAQFGIEVLREVAAGHVRIRVCGRVWRVLTDGYLNIVKSAGPEFFAVLTEKGLGSVTKIVSLIKGLGR